MFSGASFCCLRHLARVRFGRVDSYSFSGDDDMNRRLLSLLAAFTGVGLLFGPRPAVATPSYHQVDNTYLTVFAQSSVDSTAHMFSSSVGIVHNGDGSNSSHPTCGNLVWINLTDKEMFALALSAAFQSKTVHFIYDDSGTYGEGSIAGQGVFNPCRVVSLWVTP